MRSKNGVKINPRMGRLWRSKVGSERGQNRVQNEVKIKVLVMGMSEVAERPYDGWGGQGQDSAGQDRRTASTGFYGLVWPLWRSQKVIYKYKVAEQPYKPQKGLAMVNGLVLPVSPSEGRIRAYTGFIRIYRRNSAEGACKVCQKAAESRKSQKAQKVLFWRSEWPLVVTASPPARPDLPDTKRGQMGVSQIAQVNQVECGSKQVGNSYARMLHNRFP